MTSRANHGVTPWVLGLIFAVTALPAVVAGGEPASGVTIDIGKFAAGPGMTAEALGRLVGDARIIHFGGIDNDPANFPAVLIAVELLHDKLDFEALILPVGIFEADRVERKLHEDIPLANGAITLPRTWRENEAFKKILTYAKSTHGSGRELAIAGDRCQFSPAAMDLYPNLLFRYIDRVNAALLPSGLRADISRVFGGREALSQASPKRRAEAGRIATELIQTLDSREAMLRVRIPEWRVAMERQIAANLLHFVEQEDLGAGGDVPAAFIARVTAENLAWFTNDYFKGKKLIVWDGTGE